MERSGIKYMNRLGKKNTEISKETGKHRNTISKVLKEPVDKEFQIPDRKSIVDVYQPLIKRWLKENIPVKRMLEII